MDALAPDVVLLTDGGGVRKAALHPIRGADKVIRFLLGVMPQNADYRVDALPVNGGIGMCLVQGDTLDTVATLRITDGRISELYLVRNPHKLHRLDEAVALTR